MTSPTGLHPSPQLPPWQEARGDVVPHLSLVQDSLCPHQWMVELVASSSLISQKWGPEQRNTSESSLLLNGLTNSERNTMIHFSLPIVPHSAVCGQVLVLQGTDNESFFLVSNAFPWRQSPGHMAEAEGLAPSRGWIRGFRMSMPCLGNRLDLE